MNARVINRLLLLVAFLLLCLGFLYSWTLVAGGIVGLFPAIAWVIGDLRKRTMGSDVLALFSIIGTLLTHEYIAASIIAVMLTGGRVLEDWAEGQAERHLNDLISRMPTRAHKVDDAGNLIEISANEIVRGDTLLVKTGEIIPTDGRLTSPATLDESALTGEPLPVDRIVDQEISSGSVNAGAPFHFIATAPASESTYAGIITLVRSAQAQSAPSVRIANTWALRFVPLSLAIAGGAYIFTGDISRAVAVLVAATPCPLILAVPIAIVSGLSRTAQHGAIVKGGAALEALGRADTVLLDKTGTLTHGGPAITAINTRLGISDDEVIALAASVDQFSPHVVAHAIVEESKKRSLHLLGARDIAEVSGHHIKAIIDDSEVVVGQMTHDRPDWLHFDMALMVSVVRDGELLGVIGLEDPIRPESKKMVAELRAAGIKNISLVTGDRDESAQRVAHEVGIDNVYSNISASGKLDIAQQVKDENNATVIVVGDGINDAPALARADIGVAMGARGASAASEAADVVIVEDSIDRLTVALRIAQLSRKRALQSAAIGMGLSLIAMALGAFGLFSASAGAITQEVIDVVAILWALTTLTYREDDKPLDSRA